MAIKELGQDVKAAKEIIASLKVSAELGTRISDAQCRLSDALDRLAEITGEIFLLQEQNQQLRKDLTARVCPKLCAHGRGCAS